MLSLLGTGVSAALLTAFFFFFRSRKNASKKICPPPGTSFSKQSIEVEGKPGVYKCGYLPADKETISQFFPEIKTLYDVFLRGVDVSENGKCLGVRKGDGPYTWTTYAEVFQNATDFGSALVGQLGQKPGQETRVGIYARNSPAWFFSALGCISQSCVVVPLYDTFGSSAANYIIQQAEIRVIVVDSVEKAERLLADKESCPTLQHIIVIEENAVTKDLENEGKKYVYDAQLNVALHSFKSVLDTGRSEPAEPLLPLPDDDYIICYTSGTTGNPKGVQLSHRNLVANLAGFSLILSSFLDGPALRPDDCLISYLPLSHMMEQVSHWALIMYGARIGYFRGNIKLLTEDIKELQPTMFPVVPRLLNKLYNSIQARVASSGPIGRLLYDIAYRAKVAALQCGIISKDTIWDKLIFHKIQAQLGGKIRLMATGSAPISAEVLQTCRVALGTVVLEGYGQTECTALATSTWPGDFEAGHCGGPVACATIKLGDVPELNYFAKNNKGEVLVKGPSITKGYFRDEVKTAELFDEDGFLRTGDIGFILPNGSVRIIDRKKQIFKLAQGEYIAPEKIENVYMRAPVVQQIYVDGDSLERWLIAVVVPDFEAIQKWDREQNGHESREIPDICRDSKTSEYILSELVCLGKESNLNSIEQVRQVIVESELFSVDNGLLTPTLKAKRPQLRQKYKEAMTRVYDAHRNN